MPIKCVVCSTKIFGDGGMMDVVKCPVCTSMTPTGHESRIRTELERYRNDLTYPRILTGRAIGFAAGIYDFSTHDTRIDTSSIDNKLIEKYGTSAMAEHTSLNIISGRSAAGATDSRTGLMIYQASGKNYKVGGPKGQEWKVIYIVFRGSRGDKPGADNPRGAGWGVTATGQARNVDWRSNFNTRQDIPAWKADVRVHAGFLEIYMSIRSIIHQTVSKALAKSPGAAVVVTGHSLGAGLATLCAHDLDCSSICKPFCLPFCSPRAGDLSFVRDFNTRIAEDDGVLFTEVDGVSFKRAFVFVQSNDPVTWGGEHGFKNAMSAKSAVKVADSGSIVTQGIYVGLKKHKSDTVIYYHVRNLHRASYFGLHDYKAMQKVLLG
jgi:hypothetical protein